MIEPTFTSMQAMEILADDGLKACRERITKLADDLFGRAPEGKGENTADHRIADVCHSGGVPPD